MNGQSSRNLGSLLIEEGRIVAAQLEEALEEQLRTRERIGEILCRRGYLSPQELTDALSRLLGYPIFDPNRDFVESSALDFIPFELAQRHSLLPVRLEENALVVALSDPLNIEAMDQLRRITSRAGRELRILLAPADLLIRTVETSYGRAERSRSVNQLIDRIADEMGTGLPEEGELDEAEAKDRAQNAGIVNLVDQVIGQALQDRATDIHVEPMPAGFVIRYRVDGLLYDALTPPRSVYTGLVSRIKILANMDIAERRAPQDGRLSSRSGGREVDIRVSSIPTIHGEKLVLRLLNKTGFDFSLRDLGFSEDDYKIFREAIHHPYGMVLLSGPTGSGKSTTLYASLLELRSESVNITTVEDPVEYQISRINQVQINERKRVTFATALRSFLRQDPDVIMVGEIRDQDTAEIAVRAALTGHMVFSTIHANDAPSTATRLLSMGVESFMAASALTLVAAQRLVRRNCRHCLAEYTPTDEVLLAMGIGKDGTIKGGGDSAGPLRFFKGAGCVACKNRGYSRRIAIVEMMPLSPAIRDLVAANRPASDIRRQAIQEGMKTLRRAGFEKALEGVTTIEEVLRVCLSDE